MKKNEMELLRKIKQANKESESASLEALATYYKDKKPHYLEGLRIRNWSKKTKTEKAQIIRQYYKDQITRAKEDINKAKNCEDFSSFLARVEWSNNRTWGYNPTAESWINGHYGRASASGCGYDKLSASINSSIKGQAEDIIKGALIKAYIKTGKPLPYGVHLFGSGLCLNFGGCGVSTLEDILKYCGFKTVNHISGSMFDYIEAKE